MHADTLAAGRWCWSAGSAWKGEPGRGGYQRETCQAAREGGMHRLPGGRGMQGSGMPTQAMGTCVVKREHLQRYPTRDR
jgi:hypothetical protein